MKKNIKNIIILLLLIYLLINIFYKLDFLFFKVKVCNETDKNMTVFIHGNRSSFFDNIDFNYILKKVFKNYNLAYQPIKENIFFVESKKCTEYKNINVFSKLDFLFFKVKVCNETDKNMTVFIHGNRSSFFDNIDFNYILKKVFKNYNLAYQPIKENIFFVESKKCTEYKNINVFSNKYYISSKIQDNYDKVPLECISLNKDNNFITKNLKFGEHLFTIKKYKIYKNGACKLYYKKD